MKRSPIKRGMSRLERKTTLMARSRDARRRWRARKKHREQMGDDTGLGPWLRSLPCVGCVGLSAVLLAATGDWDDLVPGRCQVAHLRTRGAGHGTLTHDDGQANVIPLCAVHHAEQEGDTVRFAKTYGFQSPGLAKSLRAIFLDRAA